jgi:hypothetical protein
LDEAYLKKNIDKKQTRAQSMRYSASAADLHAEALVFTDHVCNLPNGTTAKGGNAIYQPFSLVQVYDSNMSNSKFQQVFGRFLLIAEMNGGSGTRTEYTQNLAIKEEFLLGSTPLDESLLAMRPIINKFRKSSNAKISFLAITDGEGTSIVNGYHELDTDIKRMKPKKVSRVLIDDATGRRFTLDKDLSIATNDFVVEMVKNSTDCNMIGIMLLQQNGTMRHNYTFVKGLAMSKPNLVKTNSWGGTVYSAEYQEFAAKAQEQFEENSVYSMNFGSWDQYFFVGIANNRDNAYKARKEQERLDKMKNRKIAATREFISELKREETNRMFINRLMDIVA